MDETTPSESIDDTDLIETDFPWIPYWRAEKMWRVIAFSLTGLFGEEKIFLSRMKKLKQMQTFFLSAVRHLDYYYWKIIGTGSWIFIKSVVVGLASEGLKAQGNYFNSTI